MSLNYPIGIFDSGVGGLSVAKEIRRLLPGEDIIYYADSAFCPYGDKDPKVIRQREIAIVDFLLAQGAKMIVVACNTASSAGLDDLREMFSVPIIGMEPAVKPAVAATRNGKIGILATSVTIAGERLASLIRRYANHTDVITQPCPGLVERVENGQLNHPETEEILASFLKPILTQGADTIVLGCTHYPFLTPLIKKIAGPNTAIIDSGEAVAKQAHRILTEHHLAVTEPRVGQEKFFTSGNQAEVAETMRILWNNKDVEVTTIPLTKENKVNLA